MKKQNNMKAWIARDKDERIWLFEMEPIKNKRLDIWQCTDGRCFILSSDEIPDINPQWEDEEPIEVEIKIEKI